MDKDLLKYIRRNFIGGIPGRYEAMQYYRAAVLPLNPNWPDSEHIKYLMENFSKSELMAKYSSWEQSFEQNAEREFDRHPEKFPVNRCPKCGKITYTPKSERCGYCGHTWYGDNALRSL